MNNLHQINQLAQQFTDQYYQTFQPKMQRLNVINFYSPNCNAVYNGRLYQSQQGLQELFEKRFQMNDLQIIPTSVNAAPAGDAIIISVLGKLIEPTQQINALFSQTFLLVNDGQGNFSILSDIFSIDMNTMN